jgi:hypothetical protein
VARWRDRAELTWTAAGRPLPGRRWPADRPAPRPRRQAHRPARAPPPAATAGTCRCGARRVGRRGAGRVVGTAHRRRPVPGPAGSGTGTPRPSSPAASRSCRPSPPGRRPAAPPQAGHPPDGRRQHPGVRRRRRCPAPPARPTWPACRPTRRTSQPALAAPAPTTPAAADPADARRRHHQRCRAASHPSPARPPRRGLRVFLFPHPNRGASHGRSRQVPHPHRRPARLGRRRRLADPSGTSTSPTWSPTG